MRRFDRYIIAPFKTGMQNAEPPWLIPEDAFFRLENAYVFRSRVRKRFGSYFMGYGASAPFTAYLQSRVSHLLGTTNGSGDISGTAPGHIFKVGQQISTGTAVFTVIDGNPGPQDMMRSDSVMDVATFDVSNGDFVIQGADANFETYFYPSEPIMGLTNYEDGPINNQPSYAFDTQFAYLYSNGFWLKSTGSPEWKGSNSDFFWATNWLGTETDFTDMFVTNFNATIGIPVVTDDPLYSFDGISWAQFTPYFAPDGGAPQTGPYVQTARIILPFQRRLFLLNTIEYNDDTGENQHFKARARYCFDGSPFAQNAWYQSDQSDNSGSLESEASGAGFIDASTEEEIIGAEYIKNRLIVYFERSTWEIAYTQNDANPFVWQKINTELGVESTFSTVPFDKVILGIGNVGVHACNGSNVDRIDNKIPNQIFEFQNKNNAIKRVWGIRDYFVEMVYWTYPSSSNNPSATYPNQVLVYNYRNNTWGINNDCITAFGYFEQQLDTTWANSQFTWESSNETWDGGNLQNGFRQVIAGNMQGFIFIVSPDTSRNAAAMQITQMDILGNGYVDLTIIDHTLTVNEYISVENPIGIAQPLRGIYLVTKYINPNKIRIFAPDISGEYKGGGISARVSNINILGKEWNPYVKKGYNFYLSKIDFCVLRTSVGQVSVDYYVSGAELSMLSEAQASGALLGNNILETSPYPSVPYEFEQDRLWHPVYFQGDGEFVQIRLYMNPTQITTPAIAWADFQLEGMVLFTQIASDRLQ